MTTIANKSKLFVSAVAPNIPADPKGQLVAADITRLVNAFTLPVTASTGAAGLLTAANSSTRTVASILTAVYANSALTTGTPADVTRATKFAQATFDLTQTIGALNAWKALTFVEIENIVSIPEFMPTRSTITFSAVSRDDDIQFSGANAQVTPTMDVADNPANPGQCMLNNANADNSTVYLFNDMINGHDLYFPATIAKAAPSATRDTVVTSQYQINVSETPLRDIAGVK